MAEKVEVPLKVKAMQLFFKVAGNIAPHATLPVLVKFMFLPSKRELKPPHIDLVKQGEQFFIDVPDFMDNSRMLKMSCFSWGSGDKIVLLVHGWDAKGLDYYKMIPVLVANGYKVIAFDGPAHGQSEGDLSNLVHFKEAIGKLISIIGKPYAIIGHSMGAGSSIYFLMEENIRIERLVLLAVPIISKRFFDYVFDLMQIPQRLRKALYVSMEEKFQKPIEYYNLAIRKEPIKADKIFVVYDKQDEDVPYKEIDLFLAARPKVKSMLTDGIGHNRIKKDKGVIEKVVNFLK